MQIGAISATGAQTRASPLDARPGKGKSSGITDLGRISFCLNPTLGIRFDGWHSAWVFLEYGRT
jgi:hypothetical protein